MSASPQAPRAAHDTAPPARSIAVVTYREHQPPPYVLTALIDEGLTVLERRLDPGTETTLAQLAPGLLVVCIGPDGPEELRLIEGLSRKLDAYLVVLVEDAATQAPAALDAGADACIELGADASLLKSQVRAALRRAAAAARRSGGRILRVLDLELDLGRRRVTASGQAVPLTSTEFEILAQLALQPGEAMRSADIAAAVWPRLRSEREARSLLKTHVRRIRRKLAASGSHQDYLWNVRGYGYLLEERPRLAGRAATSQHRE